MSTSNTGIVKDVRIAVRLKISALWIAMLFLFAYGDIFWVLSKGADRGSDRRRSFGDRDHGDLPVRRLGLYRDREREGLPVARPAVEGQPLDQHRVADPVHIVSIAVSAIGETSAYFIFLSLTESALLLLIICTHGRGPSGKGPDLHLVIPKGGSYQRFFSCSGFTVGSMACQRATGDVPILEPVPGARRSCAPVRRVATKNGSCDRHADAHCSQRPTSNEAPGKVPKRSRTPIHVSDEAATAPTSRKGRPVHRSLVDFGQGLEIYQRLPGGLTREQVVERLQPLLALPVEVVLPAHGAPTDGAALGRGRRLRALGYFPACD